MANYTKFLDIDIHSKLVAILIFVVILLAIWLLVTTPDNYNIRSYFSDVTPITAAIATEYTKLADSLTSLNVAKIKYNLTH